MNTERRSFELVGALLRPRWPRRLRAIVALTLCVTVLLVGRLVEIQVGEGAQLAALARANQVRRVPIEAERGVLFDRHGVQLVVNEPSWSLEAVPADVRRGKAGDGEVSEVSRLTGLAVTAIADTLGAGAADPYQPVLLEARVPAGVAQLVRAELPALPGFELQQRPVREYLDPAAFAHLLGYTGRVDGPDLARLLKAGYLPDEQVGRAGLEAGLEGRLRGQDGWRDVEVDATGRPVATLATQSPVPGHNVYLTIDASFQRAVDGYLRDELARVGTRSGAALVVDPRDGEVLAMASEPSYDDNLFTHGITAQQFAQLQADPSRPLFDTAIAGEYAPGSTFKMVTAAAALQERRITPSTQLDCPSYVQYGAWIYHNWAGGDMGYMNVTRALALSCDTFFYVVAGMLGDRTLAGYARAFGYGATTGLELPGQAAGVAPDRDWKRLECGVLFTATDCQWEPGDTLTMGIGQSFVLTTPLIQAMYVSAIANGGSLLQPTLVNRERTQGGALVSTIRPHVVRRVPVSAANLAVVRAGMRECLSAPYGTGFLFRAEGFRYTGGCKTGSAQYGAGNRLHGWFVFFAPFDNPEIAVVVLIPGGGEGHQVAEPVALKIADYYFAHRAQIRA